MPDAEAIQNAFHLLPVARVKSRVMTTSGQGSDSGKGSGLGVRFRVMNGPRVQIVISIIL